ncbi:MAG: histidine kinase internal region [Gemmatimonadetes bacterium]|nr:histidine kinase internal region [Gemmatimonadota bacterium]
MQTSEHDAPFALISDGWREDDLQLVGSTTSLNARSWGIGLLIWLAIGTTAALHQAAASAAHGELRHEWLWALAQIPRSLFWVPLTPLIFAASAQPYSRDRIARTVLMHLGLMFVAIVLVEAAYAQLALFLLPPTGVVAAQGRSRLVLTAIYVAARLGSGTITYTAVVCVAFALTAQRRLREREVRSAQIEADLSRAQVQAIKMQVQPHFLFNALHAINVLIAEDPAVATRMVTLLGDLLRHTLSRATVAEVSLREELDLLSLYLEIEQVRFQDRLTIVFDVPPDMMQAQVPELVLQPLAENAIKHGIGSSTGCVKVCISARRDVDMLVVEVVDTGIGPADNAPLRERVGLSTVRTRLEHLYGNAQSLTVKRAEGGGCVARITLPFHLEASDG